MEAECGEVVHGGTVYLVDGLCSDEWKGGAGLCNHRTIEPAFNRGHLRLEARGKLQESVLTLSTGLWREVDLVSERQTAPEEPRHENTRTGHEDEPGSTISRHVRKSSIGLAVCQC